VAIDVNTGRFVGKATTKSDRQEQHEAARKWRDSCACEIWAASVVLDFIDMKDRKNRKRVLAVLDGELRRDRATSRFIG
jgi:Ribonuclease G/E